MDKGSGENMCQIPDRADGGEDKQKLEPYFFDDPSRRALEREGNDEGAAGSLGEPWGAPGSGQGAILEALEGPNDEACPGAASSPGAPTQMAGDEQVGSLYRHVQALHRYVQALHPLMSAPNASDSHMGFSVALHRLMWRRASRDNYTAVKRRMQARLLSGAVTAIFDRWVPCVSKPSEAASHPHSTRAMPTLREQAHP